jgi:lactoylglutathione lyase
MARMIHSMIRVVDEAKAVAFYRAVLGLEVAGRFEFESFVLLYLANADTGFELELTVNKGRSERYASGEGYGHLAASVDDLDAEHQRLVGLGLSPGPLRAFALPDGGGEARFFFIEDPDGYKVEIVQRGGRYL